MGLGCKLQYREEQRLKLFIFTESLRRVPIWPSNKISLMTFLQTIVAVVPFTEVLPPKLKQFFFQILFAAVEGVCVLTVLSLSDPMSDLVRHCDFPVPDAFLDL
jgi:hypothetical protein